jgi:predicted Rossmann fold nucleotide-binding protein DprA/Smf involved in DNA uptake
MTIEYLGNKELLKQKKTAFLASNTIPLEMVLKCYDWASGKHDGCVVSGFSSKIEKDVLHFLIKAKCPIVLVLARQMYKVIPEELKEPLEQGRLLIISTNKAIRQSKATALARNKYICEIADSIIFVGVTPKSSLYPLMEDNKSTCQRTGT